VLLLPAPACRSATRLALRASLALLLLPIVTPLKAAPEPEPVASIAPVERLAKMSLEELSRLPVISVSKAPEPIQTAPASIYVITRDDILRSGAFHLMDALRLAPNLQMRQLTHSRFELGARGFGGAVAAQNFPNKLLVLIDGRSVYSPLFSGVYYDVQDLLLDDVERIEVISGPGATLWGPNAVNGVINVITRSAHLSDQPLLKAAAGNQQRMVGARHGGRWDEGRGAWRVYGKWFERDPLEFQDGSSAQNDWTKFRSDWGRDADRYTLQGDRYRARQDELGQPDQFVAGHNLLGRWEHRAQQGVWQLQAYYDYTKRGQPLGGAAFSLHSFDVELQQRLALARHHLTWGLGWRLHRYDITDGPALSFEPARQTVHIGNVFVQDRYPLRPGLDLTLGLKIERTDEDGWVPLPELRLAWQAHERHLLWAAAARAIRASTPFDREVVEQLGGVVFLRGNPGFEPERVDAFELGWRAQVLQRVSLSSSLFFNIHDDLRTVEPDPAFGFLPLRWDNRLEGRSYGLEAWAKWQVTRAWRLSPGFRLVRKDLRFEPGSSELLGVEQAGNDPERQVLLTSSLDIGPALTFDATLRHVSALPDPRLDAQYDLGAALGWQLGPQLDLQLSGSNLLEPRRAEYPSADGGQFIERAVLLHARWMF
jgi:iron complex outermembrane recepter protein